MNPEELYVSEIWIYPVKSLGGVQLESSRVYTKGLEFDRRWMLVNADGVALTQREFSKMALFKMQISENHLRVNFDGETIEIPLHANTFANEQQAEVWGQRVSALEVSVELSRWFSTRLGLESKLVFFPEDNERPVDPRFNINSEHVSLADAFPILVIGESSLQNLNSKLKEPVPMNRFRPNIVFKGGKEFAEDHWHHFHIGKNRFAAVKPCARCVMPTINQDTGTKSSEPLKTLAKYRSINNKVYFGQNVLALSISDSLRVGDKVLVETYRTEFLPLQPSI